MKTKQVISRLTEIDKPQKSKNASKNVNAIKKEKNAALISQRLERYVDIVVKFRYQLRGY